MELAFSLNKRGTPMCTSLSAKCMAAVIMGDLHPLGGPHMWEGNPISRSLIEAIPISSDADGSPLPNQPFPRIDSILRQLTPLWTNGIDAWTQLARLDPGGRPYLLPEDELQWANPHLNSTSLTAIRRPIIYLHRLMASTSLEDMARMCSQAPPKQVLRGHFAPRWRSLLQTTLSSLPAAPSPLELAQVLKQPSIRTFLAPPGQTTPPRRGPTSHPTPCVHAPIRVVIRPTRGARTRRPPKRRRLEPAPLQPLAPALGRHHQREGALISRIISRHEDRHKAQLHGHSTSADTVFLVEWGPERCTHQSLTKLQQQGFRTVSLRILDEFDDFATVDEKELDPPCVSCAKGGGDSMDPDLFQCERCLRWIHSHCLPTPVATVDIMIINGWTCPTCAPPSTEDPCPNQLCLVQLAPSHLKARHIRDTPGGPQALRTFRKQERRQPHSPQAPPLPPEASSPHLPVPTPNLGDPRTPSHGDMSPTRPRRRQLKRGRQQTLITPPPQPPPPPSLPPAPPISPQHNRNMRLQRELVIRGGTRRTSPGPAKKTKMGPPPPRHVDHQSSAPLGCEQPTSPTQPSAPRHRQEQRGRPRTRGEHPIKRSSSAAPTRIRKREGSKPAGTTPSVSPPVSPAPLPRRVLSGNGPISLEEGDPDRDTSPQPTPFASLVPPNSSWNKFNCELVGVHFPSGATVSPTLISMERHTWLYHQHQTHADSRSFDRDLVAMMARYHPMSKTPNPQGREFKLSNQWALPYELTRALHECFLTTHELFASPLNCSMADGITYASAFKDDTFFGAIHNAFDLRWTGSCLANPEYEPEDMHRAVTHALACSDASEAPFLVALFLPAWEDSPWQAESIRQHPHMETLLRLEKGQLKFVPHDKQLDTALLLCELSPAGWPVELVIIANEAGRDTFLDGHRLQQVLAPALREVCQVPDLHIPLFPRAGLVSRGTLPPPSWVDTLRPVPISSPPRAPDTPGTTATRPPTVSHQVESYTYWPRDPSLVDTPICPLRNTPVSLVEICGGIATGLEALLRAGHSIRSYAWADINPDAYLATKRRLHLLHSRYPRQLPATAIQGWDRRLPFNANCLSPEGIQAMFPSGIDLVVAGPPCQPFSTAGRHRGLEDPRSKALINVARLIHYLRHTQPHGVSYIIENVPGTDKHPEVKHMLGDPVWLDAPPCGSGAHRETLFWQNLAPTGHIQDAFNALPVPERCINDRLSEAGMSAWRSQPKNSHPPPSYIREEEPPPTPSHRPPQICVLQRLSRLQNQTGHPRTWYALS